MFKLLKWFVDNRKKTIQIATDLCNKYLGQFSAAVKELDFLFLDKCEYIEPQKLNIWLEKWTQLINDINNINYKSINKSPLKKKTVEEVRSFIIIVKNAQNNLKIHNEKALLSQVNSARSIINPVEGKMLDNQQLTCIAKDSNSHLVVAGAGTGKTTTVVGKIKFLLKTNKCKSEDILVLSFTNASASEMSERISKETDQQIDAMTFHKLGINIITSVDKIKPDITKISLKTFVKDSLKRHMEDPSYLKKLVTYLCFNNSKAKTEFEFKSQAEYDEYLKSNPPITLQNETVKSYAELDIANFLYKNGIRYIFEHPYKINTSTTEYGRYLPDFYLPDYDMYIEHFAINRNGNVPDYFKSKGNVSASEAYNNSIIWKRELHSENGTKMIELYYYDKQEGQLLQRLEKLLKSESVVFKPKTDADLWNEISTSENGILYGLSELLGTIINLIKANDYTFDKLYSISKKVSEHKGNGNLLVLQIAEPIFNDYCNELNLNNEIDFNDMINIASNYIKEGKYIHKYKYVIVDEYQDISKARYNLLKQMRDKSFYKLFCVGDDWQSIYRFAGSDISFILDFDKHWGISEKSKIETTYRFSKSLINISGQFVMKNPKQIKKSLSSHDYENSFSLGIIEGYTDKNAVDFMSDRIKDLPRNSKIYFIGRYSYDVKLLDGSPFSYQYNNAFAKIIVKFSPRNDLNIEFITAHKSKGLQADYVFIINNKRKGMGFPSKMQDDCVLELLLEGSDTYEFAEERRLFYVAMTRAKKKVWLLVQKGNESDFVRELSYSFEQELKDEKFTCPECGGKLAIRNGKFGEFFGCSNFKNGCKYTRNYGGKK